MPYASYPSIIASFNAKYIILAHKDDSILYKHRYTCVVCVYIYTYMYYSILCDIYDANQFKKRPINYDLNVSEHVKKPSFLLLMLQKSLRSPAEALRLGIGSLPSLFTNRFPKNIQQGRGSLGFLNPSTSRPPWPSKLRKWHRSLPSSRSPEFCGVTRIPPKKNKWISQT